MSWNNISCYKSDHGQFVNPIFMEHSYIIGVRNYKKKNFHDLIF